MANISKRPGRLRASKSKQVVDLLVVGLTNAEIATELGTTEQVIKNEVKGLYDDTGVESRVRFVIHYYRQLLAATNTPRKPKSAA